MTNKLDFSKDYKARQSVDILSRILAAENLTIVHDASASSASFNIKTRVLTFPVFAAHVSKEIQIMFSLHETGHAVETPIEYAAAAMKYGQSLVNILEDARIEKIIKRRYPGARKFMAQGYYDLVVEHNFLGTSNKPDPFNFNDGFDFLGRLNCYFKVGSRAKVDFSDSEKLIVAKAATLETFDDVVALAKEIKDAVRASEPKDKDASKSYGAEEDSETWRFGPEGDDAEGSDDSDETADDAEGSEGDEAEGSEGSEGDDAEGSEGSEGDDAEGSEGDDAESGDAEGDDSEGDDAESGGTRGGADSGLDVDENSLEYSDLDRQTEASMRSMTGDIGSCDVITFTKNIANIVHPWKDIASHVGAVLTDECAIQNYNLFKREIRPVVDQMVSEFNRDKAGLTRILTSFKDTGTLDSNRLMHYKTSDNIFKRKKSVRKGKNHGVVLVVDCSGSMYGRINSIMRQTLTLVEFCSRIHIPFRVYSYSGGSILGAKSYGNHSFYAQAKEKNTDPEFSKVADRFGEPDVPCIVEFLSSDMNKSVLEKYSISALSCREMSTGGTPMFESMYYLLPEIAKFRAQHKVDILKFMMFTDGEATTSGMRLGNGNVFDPEANMSYSREKIAKAYYEHPDSFQPGGGWTYRSQSLRFHVFSNVLKTRFDASTTFFFMNDKKEINRFIKSGAWSKLEQENTRKSFRRQAFIHRLGTRENYSVVVMRDGYQISSMKNEEEYSESEKSNARTLKKAFIDRSKIRAQSAIFATVMAEELSSRT